MKGEEIPLKMLSQDPYSQWLGIEILESRIGYCKVALTIRAEMLNSMGKAHGGISYALADSCFGFTANTHGKFAVSIETSINHIEALNEGDYITAECSIEKVNNKLGFNIIEVKRCQKKGSGADEKGNGADEKGNVADEKGNRADEKENRADEKGNVADEKGNGNEELVALFKGVVYRTNKDWE